MTVVNEAVQGYGELVDNLQLIAQLNDLSLAEERRILVAAGRKAAQPIMAQAKLNAPDDPDTLGGRIGDNVVINISDQTATGITIKVGDDKFNYLGRFFEFGTIHERARPWLRPAFDEWVDAALEIFGAQIMEGVYARLSKR